jgi:hypothetical protein
MCFIESDWILHKHTFSRRQLLETGLAAGLAATAGLAGGAEASSVLPGLAVGAQAPPSSGGPGTSGVRFTWFETNGLGDRIRQQDYPRRPVVRAQRHRVLLWQVQRHRAASG